VQISNDLGDSAVLEELGARLRGARLARNLSQERLAEEAGVGRVTLQRIETGQPASLVNVIRVLRTLDLLDGLEGLLPAAAPSPIDELRRQGRRRRAGSPRAPADEHEEAPRWRWGDEESESGR
jgi:transcriptional regulator with XRE-family HTH domain